MNKVNLATLACAASLVACNNTPTQENAEKYEAFSLSALDTSAHHCSDFFQYTAGGWIANNPIPDTESRWGKFDELREGNRQRILGLLDEFATKTDFKKGSDEQLIGDFYASGMDSLAVENAGDTYLQPYLQKIDKVSNTSQLLALFAENSFYNFDAPLSIGIMADVNNSSINAMYLGQGGLGLPDRDYYLKTDSVSKNIQQKYIAHIAKLFVIHGMQEEPSLAMAQRIYNVEKRMAEPMMSKVEMRNIKALNNPMTVAQLQKIAPQIDFASYFAPFGLQIDTVIVTSPKYFTALGKLLNNIPLNEWKEYYKWRVLSGSVNYLPHAYVAEEFDFYEKTLNGTSKMQPRWKRTQATLEGLSEQLGHLYVNKYFPADSKKKIETLVEDLRSAYRERIKNLTWMSDTTKTKALEKLNAFTYKIGYPDKWKDYSDLEITRDKYFTNAMNLNAYTTKEQLAKYGKPVDKDEWGMGAHIVNAYYNPLNNEVVFPAGILQPPFFDPKADDALNYGAIGGVIGHEFTHGFDDQGAEFDPQGNLVNWWTEGDKARFKALTQSLSTQYSSYEVIPGVFVNGDLTLGENIADLGGLTLAYYAYQKHVEGQPKASDIDGFTPEQRVFLGWAQVWQGHAKDEYLRNQVVNDPHSPAKFRVNGTVSNMPEYNAAFNCQPAPDAKPQIKIW